MAAHSVGFWVENNMNVLLHHPEEKQKQTTFHCPRPGCKKTFAGTPRQILNAYRDHIENSDHFFQLEYCGCCGGMHFPDFTGDCREDFDRF